ncbi:MULTISPECIES: hypothetical protein [unclassified Acinetobacter]|uniref:hypothetical protein n=1 Tax=unclassified Acinetobacter TaxID=196816 RepID=UPI0015D2061B|nr:MULTISPECIES: hypothetical protein [unclassified Acinetobacter]
MDIKRKCFEESNNVNPDWSFKFDEELQQYVALDSEMELQVDEFNEHWDTFRAGWEAKAQAVPEGFVLVEKSKIRTWYQDDDEPENFCSSESDFDDLGDCIELGDIMEINKHTQAHIQTEKLSGTWFAEAIDPSEKANFFVGTHEECMAIVEKNKAMIEAQEPAND